MPTTNLMTPFGTDIDLAEGAMNDPDRHLIRRPSDMKGYYQDEDALQKLIDDGDAVHYEVFEKDVPEKYGHVLFCISSLQPGRVGDECFMTKGHYHTILETAEVYLCLRGTGFMAMKSPDGRSVLEPMTRNRLVYVPPCWAHRSINTGDEPLVSFCAYQGDAGHNYGDIAEQGFPQRVFIRDGKTVIQ
ncbi:MAG: glucose-6-phosphate isomerase [Fuerstiella sp.]|nr:glucose-6-phosphate isomerase [Fuerstiella sp.]MCP4855680.1 glucose-6-phosphate isomerase [Fuerstiella sp.]